MADSLEIRNMTASEMEIAVEWAAHEGWNPGLHDAEVFHAADPGGFFMAWDNSMPVGCISAVRYGSDFGFVGFFIVVPDRRGHRVGIELGKCATAWLGERRTGIDGVENKVKNYHSQYGFETAYANIRYQGTADGSGGSFPEQTVPVSCLPFDRLSAFDCKFFPAERRTFLQGWLNMPDSQALAYLDADGEVTGYGVIRKCRQGCKIGPLFATTPATAETLFRALTSTLPAGEDFFLDLPEPNRHALDLARRHSMKPVFRTARMYRGGMPDLPLENIYGITSFELG